MSADNSCALVIRIECAEALVGADSHGNADPFVKLKWRLDDKHVWKTRTIEKNLWPRWEEQKEFHWNPL